MLFEAIIVFVVLLLLLVLVHEFGHFITAKWAGCQVEEFGFGFPPRLISWRRGETRYSLNLLPLGGFVKIKGEDMSDVDPGPRSFASKSAGWRVFILSAGVLMNALLAIVLLGIQAGVGFPTIATEENRHELTDLKTYILEIAEGSPAANAEIEPLDRIVSLAGVANPTLDQVQELVARSAGSEVALELERQGQHLTVNLVPRVDPPPEEGAMGVSLAATGLKKAPWWQAPWVGLKRTGEMFAAIITQFGILLNRLISDGTVSEGLTGPIGIAIYTKEVTALGLSYILEFGALISLNLAIINILPLPALDGGRILFVGIEKIVGRKWLGKAEQITHTVGFALLILLMIAITLRDVRRFFF